MVFVEQDVSSDYPEKWRKAFPHQIRVLTVSLQNVDSDWLLFIAVDDCVGGIVKSDEEQDTEKDAL